ncbi:MAG: DUF5615 family PIN-like protein [Chloracidobacterium sp.]|nr:DUF5615 family PIN-like protein [Chloracidobacterium sp.]
MISYLLDEHIPPLYRSQLLRRGPGLTVWRIGDEGAPSKGTPDPSLLIWIEENNFIIVTNNRKTMPTHLADHIIIMGRHAPGILIVDLGAPVGIVLNDLILVALASYENEFLDCVAYVPLS